MKKPDRKGGCSFYDWKTAPSLTLGFPAIDPLTFLNK